MPHPKQDVRTILTDSKGLLIEWADRTYRPGKPSVHYSGRKVAVREVAAGLEVEPDLPKLEPWELWQEDADT